MIQQNNGVTSFSVAKIYVYLNSIRCPDCATCWLMAFSALCFRMYFSCSFTLYFVWRPNTYVSDWTIWAFNMVDDIFFVRNSSVIFKFAELIFQSITWLVIYFFALIFFYKNFCTFTNSFVSFLLKRVPCLSWFSSVVFLSFSLE